MEGAYHSLFLETVEDKFHFDLHVEERNEVGCCQTYGYAACESTPFAVVV